MIDGMNDDEGMKREAGKELDEVRELREEAKELQRGAHKLEDTAHDMEDRSHELEELADEIKERREHDHGHSSDDGDGSSDHGGGHDHHHDPKVKLKVVVNGAPTTVEATPDERLATVRKQALDQTKNVAQPAENWEIKNEAGDKLDADKTVGDYDLVDGSTLWLSLGAGVAGV